MIRLLPLAAVLLFLTSCAVRSTEFSRSGWYVGASVAGAASDFDDVEGTDLGDTEYTPAAGVRVGYHFWDRFAVEVLGEGFEEFEFSGDIDVELLAVSLQAKFYPLTGVLQPYALIGGGYLSAEVDSVDFEEEEPFGRAGLGFDLYLGEHLPLFLEATYTVPSGDIDELTFITAHLGVAYRF